MSPAFPFFLILILATVFDFASKRIPNPLIFFGLLYGLFLSISHFGKISVLDSILGFIVGGSVFMLPYLKGYIGAGDVKLMAVAGLYLGPYSVFMAALYTAITGGLVVLVYMLYKRLAGASFSQIGKVYVPYAFAISMGVSFAFFNPHFL